MKLKELIKYAYNGACASIPAMTDIESFREQYYDLLDTPLEDLHLTRLDLDEMEKDYMNIGGCKL